MPDIDFQKIVLNLIPKKEDEPVVFYASQYETARPFIADLMWGDSEFTPGDSCWAEIDIRKVDDNLVVITDDVNIENNVVSVVLPVQALTCVGKNFGQIKIYADEDTLVAALNFILEVQPDPLAGGVTSDTAIDNLTTQIDDIISGEGYVKDTDLDVLQSDWDEADPTSPAYIKNKPSSGTQVQADWTEADITSPAYIQNKPDLSIYAESADLATVATSGDYDDLIDKPDLKAVATSGSYNDLTDKPTIPAAQIQSDWNQADNTQVDFIKNKPWVPVYTENETPYAIRQTPITANRTLEKLIGVSCAFNQLVNSSRYSTQTINDITFTKNADGTITVNGTASADTYLVIYELSPNRQANKFFMSGCPNGGSLSTYYLGGTYIWTNGKCDTGNGVIINDNDSLVYSDNICIHIKSGVQIDNMTFKPNIIDLTACFGSEVADYLYNLENG